MGYGRNSAARESIDDSALRPARISVARRVDATELSSQSLKVTCLALDVFQVMSRDRANLRAGGRIFGREAQHLPDLFE